MADDWADDSSYAYYDADYMLDPNALYSAAQAGTASSLNTYDYSYGTMGQDSYGFGDMYIAENDVSAQTTPDWGFTPAARAAARGDPAVASSSFADFGTFASNIGGFLSGLTGSNTVAQKQNQLYTRTMLGSPTARTSAQQGAMSMNNMLLIGGVALLFLAMMQRS